MEWQFINAKARNCFSASLSAGCIKYMTGFNYHSIRNKSINQGWTESICLRCQKIKDWEHITQYKAIDNEIRNILIRAVEEEIEQLPDWTVDKRKIIIMLKDIRW